MTTGEISVLVCDDEPVVRDALGDLIQEHDATRLVGTAADGEETVRLCGETRPDVVLLDVRMPGGGPGVIEAIQRVAPGSHVLVLSAYADHPTVLEMLRAGAAGYLVKSGPVGRILEAVETAARGGSAVADEVAHELLETLSGYLSVDDRERAAWASRVERIRQAIDGEILTMVFQPIVDLTDRRVQSVEALSRFAEPQPTSPACWFEEAWEAGLGVELELVAMARALERADEFPPGVRLAVNLSPLTVQSPMFARLVGEGARCDQVVIELTEHAPVDDYRYLADGLAAFRGEGGEVAVDDVGAGFASLRHILGIAPDIIKLDVSLTRDIDRDDSKRALATALISFADAIGSRIVAEGIETAEEEATLRELGADFGQGFFLAVPAPDPDFGPLPVAGLVP